MKPFDILDFLFGTILSACLTWIYPVIVLAEKWAESYE